MLCERWPGWMAGCLAYEPRVCCAGMSIDGPRHGVALVDQAIALLEVDPARLRDFCGWHVLRQPEPLPAEVLADLTFPSGKPLPPSLKRWLAFDASWLAGFGWFDESRTRLTPRPLLEIVREEYGSNILDVGDGRTLDGIEIWRLVSDHLPECFLLPDGSDSRRVYAVTEPDEYGEYPVLVTDNDDGEFLGVMFPGFDVYLAGRVGAIQVKMDSYVGLASHRHYASRMRTHAAIPPFNGDVNGIELWDFLYAGEYGDLFGGDVEEGDDSLGLPETPIEPATRA
jgi:hypothetical protein